MADVNARITERNILIDQDMQSYLAKLSQEKQEETARLLWLRVAAAAAARAVGLSANKQQPHGAIDLQSTYNRPRERRAAARQAELDPVSYTATPTAGGPTKTVAHGFHHRRIKHQEEYANGKNHINGLESFRGDAERGR
ncbi:MAG: hypothetical protein GF399_02980 [Candidatus Coatesbacteria bacterium]|nr:hypothetical protein [Candidatus Coatesbacteria bacterium]